MEPNKILLCFRLMKTSLKPHKMLPFFILWFVETFFFHNDLFSFFSFFFQTSTSAAPVHVEMEATAQTW